MNVVSAVLPVTNIKKLILLMIFLISLSFYWWDIKFTTIQNHYASKHFTFGHFKRNRNLEEYLTGMSLLLEPKKSPCTDNLSILVTVASTASNVEQREAIRITWASYLRTVFFIGISKPVDLLNLRDRLNDDIIVYKFQDHYQNLTLKTALMLKWTAQRCSSKVQFLLKTDDDILLNPWQLENIVNEKREADLIGYKNKDAHVYHNIDNKWYIPRWLYAEEVVPEYLSGNAYLINGKHILNILKAAYEVPLINIEDIYFTYLVARKKLRLNLSHEPRLRGFKPWLPFDNIYWNQASIHSMTPREMIKWWHRFKTIAQKINNDTT